MNNKSFLIDFGASRIKSAICDGSNMYDIQSNNPIEAVVSYNKKFEINPAMLQNQFKELAKQYYKKYKFENIFISSQMHGFALLDENSKIITNYISWKDERSLNKINGISSFEIIKNKLGDNFFKKTGMNLRPCYPIINLYHLLREDKIKAKKIKVITLGDLLCMCDNKSLNISHDTMAAGLGFYNIYDKKYDSDIIDLFNEFDIELGFFKAINNIEKAGYINIDNTDIPIYTGIGDHQCAILGAGNDEHTISVNLGTGSQIAIINLQNPYTEKRPYFNNKYMSVITHIPSGRALNTYINFLKEINPNIDYWKILSQLSLKDILSSDLNIDLATFSSAWGYNKGGEISNIKENNLTLKNYLSSLVHSYIKQYKKGIGIFQDNQYSKIILSGGIPKKIPAIKDYFMFNGFKTIIPNLEYDETLEGLKKISISVK